MEAIFGKAVIPFGELLWRFGVASAFGLVLGLDREFRGIRQACAPTCWSH